MKMKSFTFQCKTPFFRVMSFLTLSLPLVLLMGLFSGQALAVCPISFFEDDDGNLVFDGSCPPEASVLDWNSFAPTVDWTPPPAVPYRRGDATALGWVFVGQEDDQVSTADTAFAGGVKQDDSCAPLKGAKAPNKDDLKRIYLSSKTVEGHTILNLAWVRIPQNTTSASAHVGFEFNQGDTPCIEGVEDGLVAREAGDMLVVYDFEGGTAAPVITLRRWLTDTSDPDQADFFTDAAKPCDVDADSTPCWGDAKNLTALGFAEAGVNVGFSVLDGINPPPPGGGVNLADSEFGEAGIDLTEAGVFAPGQCASFGTAFGVSRSSGNSGQAQMKDLVGPVDFILANCGTVIVRKQTVPDEDPNATDFNFSTTVTTDNGDPVADFTLTDDGVKTIVNVDPDTGLTVTEDVLALVGYELTGIDCSAGTVTPTTASTATGTVTFDIAAGETLDCTYTNTFQTGDITLTKHVVNECKVDASTFTLNVGPETGTVGNDGTVSALGLAPGNYDLSEDDPGDEWQTSAISGDAGCGSTVSLGPDDVIDCEITNTRLSHIKINKVVTDGSSETFDLLIDGVVYKEGVAGWFAGDGDDAGNSDSVEAIVSNGAHTIKELQNDGVTEVDTTQWLVNISCTDGSSDQGVTELGVTTGSGELIECTIYNIPVAGASVCVE